MSPVVSKIGLLTFVSAVAAVPQGGHGYGHHHHHHGSAPSGSGGIVGPTGTGAPYGYGNGTSIVGATGTGTGVVGPTGSGYAPVPVGPATASTSVSDVVSPVESCTDSGTVYNTVYNTVTITVAGGGVGASTSEVGAVTASSSLPAYSAPNHHHSHGGYPPHSSSPVAPVQSSPAPYSSPVAPVSSSSSSVIVVPTTSSSSAVVAPTTSSSSIVVVPTTSSSSVYVAPTTSSSAVVSPVTTSASSASAYQTPTGACTSAPAYSGSFESGAKRGCAYNDATLCDAFDSANVNWKYNWGSDATDSGATGSLEYVPMLWGTSSGFTDGWDDNVKAALNSGSTALLSFNEPDNPAQANLSPAAAAAAYKQYMMPYANQARLGAPAVTNGGGAWGLDWLDAFMQECCDCKIDFVPIHWYSECDQTDYFQSQVANATKVAGGRPIWLTEFGTTDGDAGQISTFLETVMPWLDSQDYVERYSYFMASDGLLIDGTSLSAYGQTFVDYTG